MILTGLVHTYGYDGRLQSCSGAGVSNNYSLEFISNYANFHNEEKENFNGVFTLPNTETDKTYPYLKFFFFQLLSKIILKPRPMDHKRVRFRIGYVFAMKRVLGEKIFFDFAIPMNITGSCTVADTYYKNVLFRLLVLT